MTTSHTSVFQFVERIAGLSYSDPRPRERLAADPGVFLDTCGKSSPPMRATLIPIPVEKVSIVDRAWIDGDVGASARMPVTGNF